MDLKNAVAACLIALFASTLVVLIARALDLQAASRLEPQLAKIVEELQAIRKQGGIAAAPGEGSARESGDNALMVYYFHGVRCPTCRAAESNARATLEAEYAPQLKSGEVVWKVLDYMKDPTAKELAKDFSVTASTIVLVRMKDGAIDVWNRLDRLLALAQDKPALSAYLQGEMEKMLKPPEREPAPATERGAPDIPLPGAHAPPIPVPGAKEEPNPLRGQADGGAMAGADDVVEKAGDVSTVPATAREFPVPR